MVAKFNSKTQLMLSFSVFYSVVVSSAFASNVCKKNFLRTTIWVSKPAEFDAYFEKNAKKSCEKSVERRSDRKMKFLNYY